MLSMIFALGLNFYGDLSSSDENFPSQPRPLPPRAKKKQEGQQLLSLLNVKLLHYQVKVGPLSSVGDLV